MSKSVAAAVIAYRKELEDADLPAELVNDMTRDAASRLIQSQGSDAVDRLASSE
jgi:hypothetical protein